MSYEPKCEPVAWITDESLNALKFGGNGSRGSVPIHAVRSSVAKHPLYTKADLATEVQAAIEAERERCAKLVEGNHILAGGNGPNFNAGWEVAIEASASAIRCGPALQSVPKALP